MLAQIFNEPNSDGYSPLFLACQQGQSLKGVLTEDAAKAVEDLDDEEKADL